MAAAAPEPSALEEAAQAARREGLAGAGRIFVGVTWQRLRSGELGSLPVIVALAVIWGYFQAKQDVFLSARNLSNLILQIGVTGTIAVGVVLVLLLGEIDLSVGSIMILSSALLAWAVVSHGWAWYWGIAIAVLAGAAIGTFKNHWVFGDYTSGVPTAGVILLGLVIFFGWLTTRTRFGRYVFAVGGNAEAARRAGINVSLIRIVVFALSGFLAAIAGLIQTARLAAASLAINPGQVTLEAIAAAVIGGTSLFGGRGSVWSALLGALVIGSVGNGLDLIGQGPDVKLMVEGSILLLAVTVDAVARRGRAAAGRV